VKESTKNNNFKKSPQRTTSPMKFGKSNIKPIEKPRVISE
jgi:hypothetical protein